MVLLSSWGSAPNLAPRRGGRGTALLFLVPQDEPCHCVKGLSRHILAHRAGLRYSTVPLTPFPLRMQGYCLSGNGSCGILIRSCSPIGFPGDFFPDKPFYSSLLRWLLPEPPYDVRICTDVQLHIEAGCILFLIF